MSRLQRLTLAWLLQILLRTPLAEYTCIKAARFYKQTFEHLQEQAEIAQEVNRPHQSVSAFQSTTAPCQYHSNDFYRLSASQTWEASGTLRQASEWQKEGVHEAGCSSIGGCTQSLFSAA